MASRFEVDEGPPQPPECANCGAVDSLLRCSRCRTEWFCSLACHKAYWPFHRQHCRRNEFADAVEDGGGDSRFAAWLRRHGKQAVLGDVEVDRLERAGRAVLGPGREEVMDGMYGRLEPKPQPPKYSVEEQQRMAERQRREARQARLMSRQDAAWAAAALTIAPGMGMECSRYIWTQNQSHVYVHARLPERVDSSGWGGGGGGGGAASGLRVILTTEQLSVSLVHDGGGGGSSRRPRGQPMRLPAAGDIGNGGAEAEEAEVEEEAKVLFGGQLFAAVKAELSTWFVDDGVLTVRLLKRCRRGHYTAGTTNAATWWRSVWRAADCPSSEALALAHPPTAYYWSEYEEADLPEEAPLPAALPPPAAASVSAALSAKQRAVSSGRGRQQERQKQYGPAAAEPPASALGPDEGRQEEGRGSAEEEPVSQAVPQWPDRPDVKAVGRGLGGTATSHVVTALAAGWPDHVVV